jgi:hypothetical protein
MTEGEMDFRGAIVSPYKGLSIEIDNGVLRCYKGELITDLNLFIELLEDEISACQALLKTVVAIKSAKEKKHGSRETHTFRDLCIGGSSCRCDEDAGER